MVDLTRHMCRNKARPEGAGNADEPLTDNADKGGPRMAVKANISPSGDSAIHSNIAPVGPAKWRAIGDLARALVKQAEGGK